MKLVRIMAVFGVLGLLLLMLGCSEEKPESDLVIVGESVDDDVNVIDVVIPDDGLDSAIEELEELEGNITKDTNN